eukprot:TRINITY_DN19005_c1_g2_i1.p1 TRINITY_DN19005_c1_g2~~TRINITY_DN19005_c1_g2_i1.p1  ORF type:complete len:269 (+),score=45.43 TRINITY_DN19005_c1_g2_i1:74-880(+)
MPLVVDELCTMLRIYAASCHPVTAQQVQTLATSSCTVAPRATAKQSEPTLKTAWSHILVLDFEATCEQDDPTQKDWSEIIEWPCVLLDAQTLEQVGEFRELVRPTERPLLTEFCTQMTSITQDQVDAASDINEVRQRFNSWLAGAIGNADASAVLPCTCGEPDLQQMLPREFARKGLQLPTVFMKYCNIKKPFEAHMGSRAGGMAGMLKQLDIPLVGHHHLGIDDARNIANIVRALVKRNVVMDVTGGPAPKIMKRLMAAQSQTDAAA